MSSRTEMRVSARQFRAHPNIPMEIADTEIQILHLEEWQPLQTRFLLLSVIICPNKFFWAGFSWPHSSWEKSMATSLKVTNLWSDKDILFTKELLCMVSGSDNAGHTVGKGGVVQVFLVELEALGNSRKAIVRRQLCVLLHWVGKKKC